MNEVDKKQFVEDVYDKVFDCVCVQSERYCKEEDIVLPTPENADTFDRYNDYLNEVTANTIDNIVDMFNAVDMSYEDAIKAFDDITVDEFIDLDSAQF